MSHSEDSSRHIFWRTSFNPLHMPNLSFRGRLSFNLDANPGAWEIQSHCPSFYVPTKAVPLADPFTPCQAQLWGSSQWFLRHTMAYPQISLWPLCQRKKTTIAPPPHSLLCPHSSSGHVICGTQCKMKIQGPLFKKYEEFQNHNSTGPCVTTWVTHTWSQPWLPVSKKPTILLSLVESIKILPSMKHRHSHLL